MNSWNSVDKTNREYSLGPTDDLITLWRSKVKATAGCRGGEGIHVDAGVEVHLLICHYHDFVWLM